MKKTIASLLLCTLVFSSAPGNYVKADELDELNQETDKLWRRGAGAEDGAFTASAVSMVGWGIGIAAVIALVVILVNSSGSSSHSH